MAEYIDLNNTEVLTEAGENAKLVVEEDGELKRIPASAVGQVKTVNGVEPDEAGNVGVSYNNLLDKPFYETGWRYAWDGDTSNTTAVSTNGLGTLYKVSESVVDFDAMVGEISVTVVSGGVEREIVTDITDEMVAMWEETGAMLLGEGSFIVFAVVDKDKMSADSELVELIPGFNEMDVGVYFSEKAREIKSADYAIKPLDAKFLTTTVPVIQSATVGQTVVVKAVDESGKPTEWEAVDMSAGGGGAMIVRFTPESDSTVVSDTDIATVCEAMEAGRAVMGYFSLGGAKLMVGNPVEYMSPQTNTAGQIKFRFTSMSTETSMNVIDLLLTNTGVMINNFTIGSTT